MQPIDLDVIRPLKNNIIGLINDILVPILIAVAFLVFLYGVYRYFILGATSEDDRKHGRELLIYGIAGFVIIFCLWGLVNLAVDFLGLNTGQRPQDLPYPNL